MVVFVHPVAAVPLVVILVFIVVIFIIFIVVVLPVLVTPDLQLLPQLIYSPAYSLQLNVGLLHVSDYRAELKSCWLASFILPQACLICWDA